VRTLREERFQRKLAIANTATRQNDEAHSNVMIFSTKPVKLPVHFRSARFLMNVSTLAFKTLLQTFVLAEALLSTAHGQVPLKVGHAEVIRNEVVSVGEAELIRLSVGDEVVRDETLRTSDDSDARIRLLDDTKLSIGPRSTIKIDRAVYSGEKSYQEITVRLSEGAFRFITGKSDKKSYKIETPLASIGVRGTILDIRIEANQTLVALQDGEASVCSGGQCTQLLKRGHTANVSRDRSGGIRIKRELVPSWTFASVCSGNASLCAPLPPIRKANIAPAALPSPVGTSRITRFCPDGRAMRGGSCDPSRAVATDALPSGGLPKYDLSSPAPLDLPRGNTGLDSAGVGSPPLTPNVPRVQLPVLRR
jgi:FecR protein